MRHLSALALILATASAVADPPPDAMRIGPSAALECVADRYRGEALRIRDEEDGLVQELRWLTPAGNVLEVEVTGPGCRFVEVEGVGQSAARILPGQAR